MTAPDKFESEKGDSKIIIFFLFKHFFGEFDRKHFVRFQIIH